VQEEPSNRQADTQVPLHPPIANRWSPRVFDPQAVVSTEQIAALVEAARWAATWGGRQPVRFIVGVRGDETFTKLTKLLSRGNTYAHAASALILLCADEGDSEGTALYAAVDAGSAMANLSIEAVSRGLIVHPMAGFDPDGSRAAFDIPDEVRPFMVIAVGVLGDYSQAAAEIAERDHRPRRRLPLAEIAFADTWGNAALPR
jgi:nitroreductase